MQVEVGGRAEDEVEREREWRPGGASLGLLLSLSLSPPSLKQPQFSGGRAMAAGVHFLDWT